MKKRLKKGVLLLLVATSFILCMTACSKKASEENQNKTEVFTIGKDTIYLDEAWVYAKTVSQEYEKNYGSGIWEVELKDDKGDPETVENITKKDIIEQIKQVKILVKKADDYGVSLSKSEKEEITQTATEFYNGLTDEDKQETGVTLELAIQVYEENALTDKVYNAVVAEGKIEVSDEDARQTTIYDMVFDCYVDENGTLTPIADEDKQMKSQQAQAALARLQEEGTTDTIEALASEYGCTDSAQYTLSYDQYVEQYGEDITNNIFALEDGSYSQVIESQYGYHIIQMIALTDQEATQKNKASMVEELQKDYFQSLYKKWQQTIDGSWSYAKDVNQEAWKQIHFSDTTEESTKANK